VRFGLRAFAGTRRDVHAATQAARCVGEKIKRKKECGAESQAVPAYEEELARANRAAHERILRVVATKTDGARG